MGTLLQDLRHGIRLLAKHRSFTIIALLTLVFGVGANTAVFSIVNALLLRPYSFPKLDQLVLVRATGLNIVGERRISPADFLDLQRDSQVFSAVAAFQERDSSLTGSGDSESILATMVSPGFFETLGAQPALGRTFTAEEGEQGKDQVVVLNNGFWRRRFGGDKNLLGKSIEVEGRKVVVVGVMPPGSDYPPAVDLWMPLSFTQKQKALRDAQAFTGLPLQVLGRLQPGISLRQAQSQLQPFATRLQQQFPDSHKNRSIRLLQLRKEQFEFSGPLFLTLQAAAVFVLLLAAANLTNLFFVRIIERHKELAIRTAVGATRWRLTQLFLSETVPLSLFAGSIALASSFFTVDIIRTAIPADYTKWIAGWSTMRVDGRVTGFALVVTIMAGILFAVGAALQTGRYHLNESLKEAGGRSSTSGGGNRLRTVMVSSQLVFATVLMIGAGLMVQGFLRLTEIYKSFDPEHVLSMRVALPQQKYTDDTQIRSFYEPFLRGVSALPGVESVGMVTNPPASNVDSPRTLFTIEGRTVLKESDRPSADLQSVTPDFFRSLRIPLLEGQGFTEKDGTGQPRVAIISRAMARQFWPESSPIGRRLQLGTPAASNPWITIIGTVEDVKQNWWDKLPRPVIYLSFWQAPKRTMEITVRTSPSPAEMAASIRGVARLLDPNISFEGLRTMTGSISDSLAPLRILEILMLIFGAVALALSALGVYGILSHSVAQRIHEFGIRMALGARRETLLKMIISQAWKLCAIGLAVGLPLAFAVSRAMGSVLYGVVSFNAATFVALALLLTGVALLAAYVPARRATQVDPMIALRSE